MSTENEAVEENSNIKLFEEIEAYPWSTDTQFQGGLAAILGDTTAPDQIRNLTIRAQCFYFSRKNSVPIDFDAYKAYLSSKSPPSSVTFTQPLSSSSSPLQPTLQAPPTTNEGISTSKPNDVDTDVQSPIAESTEPTEPPYPKSFAEIVALIQSGATIPGQVDIPTTILPEQATKPVARKRLKPWEVELKISEEAVQGAGAPLPSDDPSVVKVIEGTFGDQRDQIITQELPDIEAIKISQ